MTLFQEGNTASNNKLIFPVALMKCPNRPCAKDRWVNPETITLVYVVNSNRVVLLLSHHHLFSCSLFSS